MPLGGAFNVFPYNEGNTLSIIASGYYEQLKEANDNFDTYASGFNTGTRYFFSGSGFWNGSGYTVAPNTIYWFDTIDTIATGQYTGGFDLKFVTGNELRSGYFNNFQITSGYVLEPQFNYWFENFDKYESDIFVNYLDVDMNNILISGEARSGYYSSFNNPTGKVKFVQYSGLIYNKGGLYGYFQDHVTGLTTGMNGVGIISPAGTGFVRYPINTGTVLTDFTIEFWVNRTGAWDDNARFIDNDWISGFAINRSGTNANVRFEILNDNSSAHTNIISIQNQWQHLAFVRSGATTTVYSGGLFHNIYTTPTGYASGISGLSIGTNNSQLGAGGEKLQGIFSSIRLWGYPRASGDITNFYDKKVNAFSSGLLLYSP